MSDGVVAGKARKVTRAKTSGDESPTIVNGQADEVHGSPVTAEPAPKSESELPVSKGDEADPIKVDERQRNGTVMVRTMPKLNGKGYDTGVTASKDEVIEIEPFTTHPAVFSFTLDYTVKGHDGFPIAKVSAHMSWPMYREEIDKGIEMVKQRVKDEVKMEAVRILKAAGLTKKDG